MLTYLCACSIMITFGRVSAQYPVQIYDNCPEQCNCAQVEGIWTTNCNRQNLPSVPFGIPPRTMRLTMSRNNLGDSLVSPGYFYERGLTSLVELDLSYSRILEIGPATFQNLTILRAIDLSGNNLTEIAPWAFSGLGKLTTLDLSHNQLLEVSPGRFRGAPSIESIDLSFNRIRYVDNEAFKNVPKLKFVYLQNNKLFRLSPNMFSDIPYLDLLNLVNNVWVCDCLMRRFIEWKRTKRRFTESPKCHQPERYRGKSWDQLTLEEFACAPEFEFPLSKTTMTVRSGTKVVFECPMRADPKPKVEWEFRAKNQTGRKILRDGPGLHFYNSTYQNKLNAWTYKLTILKADLSWEGSYTCLASNKGGTRHEYFHLSIHKPVGTAENSGGQNTPEAGLSKIVTDLKSSGDLWLIVVIIAVALVLIIILLGVVCFFRRGLAGRSRSSYNSVNNYDYRVIEGGFRMPSPPQKPDLDHYYSVSPSALYELRPNVIAAPVPPLELQPGNRPLTACSTAASDDHHSHKLPQDDSGYMDGPQPSPLISAGQKHSAHQQYRYCGSPQLSGKFREHPLPAWTVPIDENCALKDPTVRTQINGIAPLAQQEKDIKMPLRETSL